MTEPRTYTLDVPGAVLSYDVRALDAGPVDIFVSSGGAVNALALVARHPE